MKIVNTHQAKTHLSQLLQEVSRGEEIVIARAGKPVARLIGIDADDLRRTGGEWAGRVHIAETFDDPLPADIGHGFGIQSS